LSPTGRSPRRNIRRNLPLRLSGVPVPPIAASLRRLGSRLRCGPSAHGISPFAALLRPDSSASASSAPAKAHLSFPRTGTSTSMILFEASAVLSNPSQPCRDRIRFGRSGCGGFDSWALTRPHQPSAARVADGGELMLPWALPLSGLPDTGWCKRPGSLIDLRLPPMDRQDLPGFAHRSPAHPLPVALRS
jgi:hypothetical protein